MDLLTEALRDVRVRASALATFRLRTPFHLDLRYPMPFSLTVMRGRMSWGGPAGAVIDLAEGDSLLVLDGGPCCFASDLDLPAEPFETAWRANQLPDFDGTQDIPVPLQLQWGGSGDECELLAVAFGFAGRQPQPTLSCLPAALFVPRSPAVANTGITAAAAFLKAEGPSAMPGYGAMANHFAEAVLLGLVRTYALQTDASERGLMSGLGDRHLANALRAFQASPGEAWTVAKLSRAAGLSRTVFAARFAEAMNATPMDYITRRRMQMASLKLKDDGISVPAVAEALGYASERAFRAAFERHFGVSPGTWRRRARLAHADR